MPFQSLYNHTFSESANLAEIAGRYPYFSAAHFFLLQQTDAAHAGYEKIAAKTALHFANPYLLNNQLHAKETVVPATAIEPENKVEEDLPLSTTIKTPENNSEKDVPVEEPVIQDKPATLPVQENTVTENTAAPAIKKEDQPALLFEPLHTTDYFASQGIRLSEVVQPGDKMGRQLKSFTEWLKTMKKVHPDGLKEKTEGFIDPSVQKLAEKSNKEEDVLTESMAEVYIQQGKTNKAKEIYEKLSLLNPSKNAYFAAKINEIQ